MKKTNLDELLGDLEPFKEEKSLKVELGEASKKTIADLLQIYEGQLEKRFDYGYYGNHPNNSIREFYADCLSSVQGRTIDSKIIDEFVLRMSEFSEHSRYSQNTGLFVTALLQTAFDNNQNNFEITLASPQPINYLGYRLRGQQGKRLAIKIQGIGKRKAYVDSVQWFQSALYLDVTLTGVFDISMNETTFHFSGNKFKTDKAVFVQVNDTIKLLNHKFEKIKVEKAPAYERLELAIT